METGEIDKKISTCYEQIINFTLDKVRKYVISYISKNIILLTDVDNVAVTNEVVDMIKNTNTINIVDLLLGKYNDKIEEIVDKNRNYNQSKRLAEMPDTIEYIRSVIEIYPGENINIVNQNINKVDMRLRDEGLSAKEIVSKKYDLKIRRLYNSYRNETMNNFYNNSIKRDDVPDKYEPVKGKIDLPAAISGVILVATLLSALGYGTHQIIKESKEKQAMDAIRKDDPYSYSPITSIYDDDFKPTLLHTIESYSKYCEYGAEYDNENYNYLAFYEAYNSVSDKKLYVMDGFLAEVKQNIEKDTNYASLRNELIGNSCYLSFIYDRLESMGYTQIRDDKYQDLLQDYMEYKRKYPYKDPVEYLDQVKTIRLEKVLQLYEEYSNQYLIELGVLLKNENNTESHGR